MTRFSWADRFSCVSRGGVRHFLRVLLLMGLLVGLLAIVELTYLWVTGTRFAPRLSITDVECESFTTAIAGGVAVSRIEVQRAGDVASPLEHRLLRHDPRDGHHASIIEVGRQDIVSHVLSPDGRQVAFATTSGLICVTKDLGNHPAVKTIADFKRDLFIHLAWSPNGERLAASGREFIYLWEMPFGRLLHQIDHGSTAFPQTHFSADSETLVGTSDAAIRVWDVREGTLTRSIPSTAVPMSCGLTRDGHFVSFVTLDGSLQCWSIPDERRLWRLKRSPWRRTPMAVSPAAPYVVTIEQVPGSVDVTTERVVIRHVMTGKYLYSLRPSTGRPVGLNFSSNGTLYVWSDQGTISGWNLEAQAEIFHVSLPQLVY